MGGNTSLNSSANSLPSASYGGLSGEGSLSVAANGGLTALNGYAMPLDRWTPNTREWLARNEERK